MGRHRGSGRGAVRAVELEARSGNTYASWDPATGVAVLHVDTVAGEALRLRLTDSMTAGQIASGASALQRHLTAGGR